MEKARYNTELYSNLSPPLDNVKPSNFWGSHQYLLFYFFIKSNSEVFTSSSKPFAYLILIAFFLDIV